MIEFIDKTSEKPGTYLNRTNMMALQGYQNETVQFFDNSIVKTNSKGEKETIIFEGNKITKTLTGEKTITIETEFTSNGYTRRIV